MKAIVYLLIAPNSILYVGSTNRYTKRKTNHLSDLRGGVHKNRILQRIANKYGVDGFSFHVLEECTESDRFIRELFWIASCDSHNSGANLVLPDPSSGVPRHTEATKEAIGLSKIGHSLPEESKERIRLFLTGRKASAETRAKQSEAARKRRANPWDHATKESLARQYGQRRRYEDAPLSKYSDSERVFAAIAVASGKSCADVSREMGIAYHSVWKFHANGWIPEEELFLGGGNV